MSPFELKVGDKVYNPELQITGEVTSVRETSADFVAAFILWPNEIEATQMPLGNKYEKVAK